MIVNIIYTTLGIYFLCIIIEIIRRFMIGKLLDNKIDMIKYEIKLNDNYKEILLSNINNVHTTKSGMERIKNNLKLSDIDVISYLKGIIKNNNSIIYKIGKNYYCEQDNIKITINSYNYSIITAHLIKK